ncbi:growth-regulating factor 5 isoform X2 [Beta vulgaris subsp. vulgaris]|uniref:growth-regulating factor 5 isoform X2 n=1 Tax=Beta vulgaris subsp. vulgaris TaxID=3555 RepID=UPI0025499793|nr:growth-regulating factor 5 isoform X2 [Beta vulgaris subsp. vulgaris]
MMILDDRNNKRSPFPFTASQWKELEQQLLTFKYLISGVPVPPQLFSNVITNPFASSSSTLFPYQQSLPFGWGCFQVGYGRKIDPEPGRCRRTDGKKWRCSKEAFPDSKYCEKHMHRGKNKTKKHIQVFSTTPPKTTTTNTIIPTTPSTTNKPYLSSPVISSSVSPSYINQLHSYDHTTSFYPFLSPQSSSFSTHFTESTQNVTAPHWLLDTQLYDDQPKKDMRSKERV